jgi:glycosyltransferase involved in cell wall biosynthesis
MQKDKSMSDTRPLRIAIDCRIPEARQGIGTAVLFLASVLSQQPGKSQEYTFLVNEDLRDWLAPHIAGPCRLAVVGASAGPAWKRRLRTLPALRRILQRIPRPIPAPPLSDGYIERHGFDLVHFPTQQAMLTSTPSIYQPWDLQHVHCPQFFSARDLAIRDRWYRAFCNQASAVCVQAEWTRQDVIASYAIPPQKVVVIPWGSTFKAYTAPTDEMLHAARARYQLPEQFFFYPAVTWPHKNHAVILRALAWLKRTEGRVVHLCLTGAITPHQAALETLAGTLGVAGQVHRMGFLSTDDLQCIYASATAMVFPSLFEGFGLPLLEAFHARLPVISSNATVLPEIAQDAALFFDPGSEQQLADQMRRMLDDPALRRRLQQRGTEVLGHYDSQQTAQALHDLYASVHAQARPVGTPLHSPAVVG